MPGTEHLTVHYKQNGPSGNQTPLGSSRSSTPHPGQPAATASNQSRSLIHQIHNSSTDAVDVDTSASTTTQSRTSASVEPFDFWSDGGDITDTGAQSVEENGGDKELENACGMNVDDDDAFEEAMRHEAEKWGKTHEKSSEAVREKKKSKDSEKGVAMSDYEHDREANIARNKVLLASLGLDKDIFQKNRPVPRPRRRNATSALEVPSAPTRRSTRQSS
jgi:hypothetical protein